MRIGSWVAQALERAAAQDLGDELLPKTEDAAVLKKMEQMAEAIRQEFKVLSEQNKALDEELALIRRGLLPKFLAEQK